MNTYLTKVSTKMDVNGERGVLGNKGKATHNQIIIIFENTDLVRVPKLLSQATLAFAKFTLLLVEIHNP
jgi:hypothetical protein